MRQEVILRALQKSDLGAIEDIIRRAWHYDDLAGPDTARQLAAVFLRSCLKNQTFVRVAAVDGVPVGVIMGRSDRSYRWRLREATGQAAAILRLLASREGRAVSRIFRSVDSIDRQLLAPRRAMFQGELSFFAVREDCRGLGVGQKLFDALRIYMRREDVQRFYLFTDTSCNYGFYEHQGMRRCAQQDHIFDMGGRREEMHFFLYSSPPAEQWEKTDEKAGAR